MTQKSMNIHLDSNNHELWNNLNNQYKIVITEHYEYAVLTEDKSVEIFYNVNNIKTASFTHELLHLYLHSKEFYLGRSISNYLNELDLTPVELQYHISNCLDHIKMLPMFIEMGYNNSEFLGDYSDLKCTKKETQLLSQNFKLKNGINSLYLDLYIGKLFAMLCDSNSNNNYSKHLVEFNRLDPKLFSIIKNLIDETYLYNLEDKLQDYINISMDFTSNLNDWITNTKIY